MNGAGGKVRYRAAAPGFAGRTVTFQVLPARTPCGTREALDAISAAAPAAAGAAGR